MTSKYWQAVCILALVALSVPAFGLQDTDWLYAVEQPVDAQTDAERSRAASAGLLTVLTRVTGLLSIPRNAVITAALERPQAYYNRFQFARRTQPNGMQQTVVRITFQQAAVQALLQAADLPVWWSRRPTVLAWVVMDAGGQRQLLGADSTHPVLQALMARADQRGLALRLPAWDATERERISTADVWGRVGHVLDAAALRYHADIVMVGRIARAADRVLLQQPYAGDWEAWIGGRPVAVNYAAIDAAQVARLGIDLVADAVAEQYTVLPRALQSQRLSVAGVVDLERYAAFMRYLQSLEFIDRVAVTGLAAEQVEVAVDTRAAAAQLQMLLTAEQRLALNPLSRGPGLHLIWRG